MRKQELNQELEKFIAASEVALTNKLSKGEIQNLANELTDNITDLLIGQSENVENLFNIDNDAYDQPEVFVLDGLFIDQRIDELKSVIPHCKTREEAEQIQSEIDELEEEK